MRFGKFRPLSFTKWAVLFTFIASTLAVFLWLNYATSAIVYLPKVLGIKRVIYEQRLEDRLAIYELSDETIANLKTKGLRFLAADIFPRRRVKKLLYQEYISWRETPMMDDKFRITAPALTEATNYRLFGPLTFVENLKHQDMRNFQAANEVHRLLRAARKPGSYFTMTKSEECGLLVDPDDKLAMFACVDN